MAFELFEKKGGRYTQPRVSITRAGQIGMNAACLDKYLKNTNYALLYYDKDKKTIGIKPVDKQADSAFRITSSNKRASGSISGRSFLSCYGIDFSKKKRFTPSWSSKEQMLIFKVE